MVLLSSRQELVLKSIDRFGVITATQLVKFLKEEVSHVTVYNTKTRLVKLGLISEEKIGYQSVLSIKPSGVNYLGSSLTPFTKLNLSMLKHQLLTNDCILSLFELSIKKEKETSFITERELRSNYLDANFSLHQRRNTTLLKSVPDRIPDFVIKEGDIRIAYEVELTQKTARRYQEKFKRYQDEILNNEYDLVRYLCETEKIKDTVVKNAAAIQFPKEMLQVELVRRVLGIEKK